MPLDQRLLIFVKAPRPGTVKTRLATDLGPEAACAAYRELAKQLFTNLSGALVDVDLHFSPADAAEEIRPWLREGWTLRPQSEGDLGARMNAAFVAAFADGVSRVILIGSDCPDVMADDIRTAWDSLEKHDLVLGPARDGGYWLIGLTQSQPVLFENIPWSTACVFEETVRRAESARLRVHRLRELEDVDTAADWRRFEARRNSLEAAAAGC
ncbi:MAG: glycosyltransferase [Pedosphaera sp.]|nr:glycosyltransferase [Pedosphaera sp.]MST00405.1 glycosyltransferase [Pedosphaera sp.]